MNTALQEDPVEVTTLIPDSNPLGGEKVAAALLTLGVDCAFCVASVHNLPIVDALTQTPGVQVIMSRHEQGAVHAADAYSRLTGKLGVAIVSTGPGTANAMGGLFEADFYGSSVLLITGQVPVRYYGSTVGYVHEAERQVPMLRSVTQATHTVLRALDIEDVVLRAGVAALSAPRKPVAVEIPIDLQYERSASRPVAAIVPAPPCASMDVIEDLAGLIATAERPILWIGSDIYSSDNHLSVVEPFAIRLGAGVLTTHDAKGAFPENHTLSLGANAVAKPVRQLLQDADLVLAFGNRFPMYETDYWSVSFQAPLVHVHSNTAFLGRGYPAIRCIQADPSATLQALLGRNDWTGGAKSWLDQVSEARAATRAAIAAAIGPDHLAFCESLQARLPDDAVLVRDLTVPSYTWGDKLLQMVKPRRALRPASSAIGPAIPFSIGAAVATGKRTVVIQGDGGAMLSVGELATVAQYELPITICVFNDACYGVLRDVEHATFGGRTSGVDMPFVDFEKLASGFGIKSETVVRSADFDGALHRALAHPGPSIIAVDLRAMQRPKTPDAPGWRLGDR